MQAKKINEGTSGYSRSLPYQNYKSLFTLVEGDDEISGGRADDLTPEDIAKKHNVKTKAIKRQLDMGEKIEMEHTDKPKLSKEIASDHVEEIPDYYDRLKDMEAKALKVNEESIFKAKTPEELRSNQEFQDHLERLQNKLSNLSGYHPQDDSPYGGSIKDSRAYLRNKIKDLKDLITTPEQQEKKWEQRKRASDKRHAKQSLAWDEKEKKLKTITSKQKAINKLIDLISWRQYLRKHNSSLKERKKLSIKIEDLKAHWNLKSYDLRRQKEYDPAYDDSIVNEAKKKPTTKKGKDKKFKKVMGEFGKGELKPYRAKKTLKSKKQKGSKKDHKQALAIAFSEAGMSESSSVAVGYFSGSVISPKDQRRDAKTEKIAKFKKANKESEEELEEEMVHPDDKIGNAMLKKMKVPQPFTSNKKGEVHQKKVDK